MGWGGGGGGGGILNSPTTTGWSISILCKSPSHGEAGGVQRACEVVSAQRRPSRAPPAASIYLSANRHADTSGEANTFDRRRHDSKVGCCQTPEFQRGRNGPRANSHSQKFAVLPSALVLTSSWMVPVDPAMLEVHTHCNHVMWQHSNSNFFSCSVGCMERSLGRTDSNSRLEASYAVAERSESKNMNVVHR